MKDNILEILKNSNKALTVEEIDDRLNIKSIEETKEFLSLLNELEYTTGDNHAESVTQDADLVITSLSGSNPTTYAITATTVNCGLENSATSAIQNTSYTTTITPDEGYAVNNVTVAMIGNEIGNTTLNKI